MWGCLLLTIIWATWSERNHRIFDDAKGLEVEELWDKVSFEENCLTNSIVKRLVQSNINPMVLLHGFDRSFNTCKRH
ncbi:hypothetical protein CerSpe_273380 [Prunus speciosa]